MSTLDIDDQPSDLSIADKSTLDSCRPGPATVSQPKNLPNTRRQREDAWKTRGVQLAGCRADEPARRIGSMPTYATCAGLACAYAGAPRPAHASSPKECCPVDVAGGRKQLLFHSRRV